MQPEVLRGLHLLGQLEGGRAGLHSVPCESCEDVDHNRARRAGGRSGFLDLTGNNGIVDHEEEVRVALRERDGARDVVLTGGLAGPEDAFEAGG